MKHSIKRLVVVSNGSPETRPSLTYGAWLADQLKLPVRLLGLKENEDHKHPVATLMDETRVDMEANGIQVNVDLQAGPVESLLQNAMQQSGDLFILGPMGRPLIYQFLTGNPFRLFMEKLTVPVLYVPTACLPIKRILVCMGGLEYGMAVFHTTLELAIPTQASLSFLHVVEPVTMDYPLAHQVESHWQDLMQTDTPQGRNLKRVVEEARENGLNAEVKLRHGAIAPEILHEVKTGGYDLVCMGSIYSARSLRHITLPNITAEIAEAGLCPILSVRSIPAVEPSSVSPNPKPPA